MITVQASHYLQTSQTFYQNPLSLHCKAPTVSYIITGSHQKAATALMNIKTVSDSDKVGIQSVFVLNFVKHNMFI